MAIEERLAGFLKDARRENQYSGSILVEIYTV
jgi:hypothetical protein